MKIFVTVIGLWLVWLAPMAFGEEVKRETAQTVAKNWYAHCKGTRGAQISRTVTGEYAGRDYPLYLRLQGWRLCHRFRRRPSPDRSSVIL